MSQEDLQPNEEPTEQLDDDTTDHVAQEALGLISRFRLHRAHAVVKEMDRKDRLYDEIGGIAASGHRDAPTEKPQTLAEHAIDWRLQRKSKKKIKRDIYADRAAKIHGHDRAPHVPSVRHGITESALGVAIGRDHSHSIGQVLWGNIKRLFDGPDIEGYTPLKRKIEKAKVIGRIATAQVTAAEAQEQWLATNAEQMKLGNKMHKRTRRQQRKHSERASIVAEGPIRARWRDGRRRRAQKTIDRLGS